MADVKLGLVIAVICVVKFINAAPAPTVLVDPPAQSKVVIIGTGDCAEPSTTPCCPYVSPCCPYCPCSYCPYSCPCPPPDCECPFSPPDCDYTFSPPDCDCPFSPLDCDYPFSPPDCDCPFSPPNCDCPFSPPNCDYPCPPPNCTCPCYFPCNGTAPVDYEINCNVGCPENPDCDCKMPNYPCAIKDCPAYYWLGNFCTEDTPCEAEGPEGGCTVMCIEEYPVCETCFCPPNGSVVLFKNGSTEIMCMKIKQTCIKEIILYIMNFKGAETIVPYNGTEGACISPYPEGEECDLGCTASGFPYNQAGCFGPFNGCYPKSYEEVESFCEIYASGCPCSCDDIYQCQCEECRECRECKTCECPPIDGGECCDEVVMEYPPISYVETKCYYSCNEGSSDPNCPPSPDCGSPGSCGQYCPGGVTILPYPPICPCSVCADPIYT